MELKIWTDAELITAFEDGCKFQHIEDLRDFLMKRRELAATIDSGLHKHGVTNRTYKCSRCGTEYIPVSGKVDAGCCIMPVDYRTSGICGGELIEVT